MVDTDNAKSEQEFKKLSKCMGDKLDKLKGGFVIKRAFYYICLFFFRLFRSFSVCRGIEELELEPPDFKHNAQALSDACSLLLVLTSTRSMTFSFFWLAPEMPKKA